MKVVGYVRVSTGDQVDSGLGLEAQRLTLTLVGARILDEPWSGPIHEDAGVSGKRRLEFRPGLVAAIEELGKGDVLLVARRDRMARDPMIAAMVERLVARRGARIVSAAGEGSDDDSPHGVLIRGILDLLAQYEGLLIAARTKAAMAAKRARGERYCRSAPLGWQWGPTGALVHCREEQLLLRNVKVQLAEGERSPTKIARAAQAAGLRGRDGAKVTRNTVRRIMERVES